MRRLVSILMLGLLFLGLSVPAQSVEVPSSNIVIRNVTGSNHSIAVYPYAYCQGNPVSVYAGNQTRGRSYKTYWTSRSRTYSTPWEQLGYSTCRTTFRLNTYYVYVYQGRV